MDGRIRPTSTARIVGREEMQALALSVVGSLERAGLGDMLAELRCRVLDRDPDDMCESEPTERDTWHLRFKPIVELLLYEIRDVARMPHLSDERRRERIEWAMRMSGV